MITITPLSPIGKQSIRLHSACHEEFIRNGGGHAQINDVNDVKPIRERADFSFGEPVKVHFKISGELPDNACVTAEVSLKKDFFDFAVYPCINGEAEVYNLLLGTPYYWRIRVCHGNETLALSSTESFLTEKSAPRFIRAGGLGNVRDLGGWPAKNGKWVRQGLLFRGCEMDVHNSITEDGKSVLLNELGIKTDLDLREEVVGKIETSALGENVNFALIPVHPYDKLFSTKDAYLKIFKMLTVKENYPLYFHCWSGADRTGTLSFLIHAVLGVEKSNLFLDYELTSFSIWGARNVHSDVFTPFLSLVSKYGDENADYCEKCERLLYDIGITTEDISKIRNIMLE